MPRYSTDKQDESSIRDQVRVCTEYADKYAMRVVAEFKDEGISGAGGGQLAGSEKDAGGGGRLAV